MNPTKNIAQDHGAAWLDGCNYGQRCAQERYLWLGMAIGVVVAVLVILAGLNLMGALK